MKWWHICNCDDDAVNDYRFHVACKIVYAFNIINMQFIERSIVGNVLVVVCPLPQMALVSV